MDQAAVELLRELLGNTPKYNDKWDVLKPVIEELYLEQRKTVPEICQLFTSKLDFPA
jgi:Clr5-like protein